MSLKNDEQLQFGKRLYFIKMPLGFYGIASHFIKVFYYHYTMNNTAYVYINKILYMCVRMFIMVKVRAG